MRIWDSVCSTKRSIYDSYGNDEKKEHESRSGGFFSGNQKAIFMVFELCATDMVGLEIGPMCTLGGLRLEHALLR